MWFHNGTILGGKILPHFDVKIMDENDDFLPAGEIGEIVIRPKEAGVMSDDILVGLTKQMRPDAISGFTLATSAGLMGMACFISAAASPKEYGSGKMVSGFEVEEGALSHENIEDAASTACPLNWARRMSICLSQQSPARHFLSRKSLSFGRTVMAKFMVPKFVSILEEMLRTPTGATREGQAQTICP